MFRLSFVNIVYNRIISFVSWFYNKSTRFVIGYFLCSFLGQSYMSYFYSEGSHQCSQGGGGIPHTCHRSGYPNTNTNKKLYSNCIANQFTRSFSTTSSKWGWKSTKISELEDIQNKLTIIETELYNICLDIDHFKCLDPVIVQGD